MSQVLPVLMQAFKGLVPSQLYEHYQQEGGNHFLEFDLAIATEMQDQMAEIYGRSGSGPKARAMKSRRDQRRAQRRAQSQPLTDGEAIAALKDFGIDMGGE